jgi:serine/threonine protein phosphatase PrpC
MKDLKKVILHNNILWDLDDYTIDECIKEFQDIKKEYSKEYVKIKLIQDRNYEDDITLSVVGYKEYTPKELKVKEQRQKDLNKRQKKRDLEILRALKAKYEG